MIVSTAGTRRCRKAWTILGNSVTATSRIANCTESHDRITMLTKRSNPISVMVKSQIINRKDATGAPGMENSTVIAARAKGRAINDRRNVKPKPSLEKKLAIKMKAHAGQTQSMRHRVTAHWIR